MKIAVEAPSVLNQMERFLEIGFRQGEAVKYFSKHFQIKVAIKGSFGNERMIQVYG